MSVVHWPLNSKHLLLEARTPKIPRSPKTVNITGFGSPGSLGVLESSYSSWSRTPKTPETPNIPNFDYIGNPGVKTPETPKALQIGGFGSLGSLDSGIANIIKIWDIGSLGSLGSPGPWTVKRPNCLSKNSFFIKILFHNNHFNPFSAKNWPMCSLQTILSHSFLWHYSDCKERQFIVIQGNAKVNAIYVEIELRSTFSQ